MQVENENARICLLVNLRYNSKNKNLSFSQNSRRSFKDGLKGFNVDLTISNYTVVYIILARFLDTIFGKITSMKEIVMYHNFLLLNLHRFYVELLSSLRLLGSGMGTSISPRLLSAISGLSGI